MVSNQQINLLRIIVNGITSKNIMQRIIWMYFSFFFLLVPVTTRSFYLLPEGVFRGKHPLIGFELSPVLWLSILQIFGYNLVFTLLTVGANLFARQSRIYPEKFVPFGYLAFWGVTITMALYMGTWSQDIVTPAPPLLHRFIRLFDIFHHAGFWEISAYLLTATTSFRFTLIYTDGKKVIARKSWRNVIVTTSEKILFALSFFLLIFGAFIESYGIQQLDV
jgi:hypothetical protein